MVERARAMTVCAAFVVVAMGLASLGHTHDHAVSQGRSTAQACVFCSHAVAAAPGVAPLAPPLPTESEPVRPAPRPVSLEVVISHPARGPPPPAAST